MGKRRFIFNNDGSFTLSNNLHGGRQLTVADVHGYVDQVAGTGITSFFICSGSSMPYYTSRHERTIGCLGPQTVAGDGGHPHSGDNCALYGIHALGLRKQGTDIVEQCVSRAHARGMEAGISMRMNDLHFTAPGICYPLGQGDFWLEHPEYRLGDLATPGWHTEGAHDYSHAAVREHKLPTYAPCRIVTRPLVFAGGSLSINFSSSAAGSVRIRLEGEDTALDSIALFGDSVNRTVEFQAGKLEALAGTPVEMEITMSDADIYSFQFT
jgi:hypothetical protein